MAYSARSGASYSKKTGINKYLILLFSILPPQIRKSRNQAIFDSCFCSHVPWLFVTVLLPWPSYLTKSILLARGAGDASGKRRFGPSAEAGSARGRARASTSRRPPRRGAALPDAEDARARMATEREESESFILRRKHALTRLRTGERPFMRSIRAENLSLIMTR